MKRYWLLRVIQAMMALIIVISGVMLPVATRPVFAEEGFDLGLASKGPTYATAGSNITYELVLENFTDKVITDIGVFNPIPADTTYVSGGNFVAADDGVEFPLASLAARATHKFTLVVKVNNGVAVGTVIENTNIEIYQYTIPGAKTSWYADGSNTTVEAPATYLDGVLQNPSVNHRLKLDSSTSTYDATPQANAPAGVYRVEAIFTNVTEVQFSDLSFAVVDLGNGNVLLNADGGPAGNGATLSVPATALGDDGILHVNESVTVAFEIGLASAEASSVTLDANGVPHDWTHEAPALAGEANNASFVFAVEAGSSVFLPFLIR